MRAFHLLAALVAVGCSAGKGAVDSASDGALDADTQALVDAMDVEASGYASWSQTADWTGVVATPGGAHGEAVQIWWNPAAYDTIQAQAGGDMPEGALVVKEGYDDAAGTDTRAVTFMWKKDGSWFWVGKSAAGAVSVAGYDLGECAGCHAASTNDSIMAETY